MKSVAVGGDDVNSSRSLASMRPRLRSWLHVAVQLARNLTEIATAANRASCWIAEARASMFANTSVAVTSGGSSPRRRAASALRRPPVRLVIVVGSDVALALNRRRVPLWAASRSRIWTWSEGQHAELVPRGVAWPFGAEWAGVGRWRSY